MSKKRKNVESVVQVFTFLHLEIANEHFTLNNYTHLVLYIQHYIKTIHFWLKYNGVANVRNTPKLIEGSHRGLQDYRFITLYVITCTFFTFFTFFQIQKVVTFYVFCRVSYVFSNYETDRRQTTDGRNSVPIARPLVRSAN